VAPVTDPVRQDRLTGGAREIAEVAAANGDVIDRDRELPATLLDRIRLHGFFRLLVPARYGGAELPLPVYVPLIEAVAQGDASTAWCINQAAVYATMSARADPETAIEIWGDATTAVANGPPVPAVIESVNGGHRLTGRWDFSSGCRHANWFAATTSIDGRLTVSMVPRRDVTLVDVWDVHGLRGTGSFSFAVDDVFVPSRRAFAFSAARRIPGSLYGIPINLLFAAGFAAVALGNARGALDAARVLLQAKRPVFERDEVRARASVQLDVARAEAVWGAARTFLAHHVQSLWQSAEQDGEPGLDVRIGLRLAATHAIHSAAEAVQVVYRVCGSTVIFERDPMQRRFQDAHVITQQVQGRLAHYETVGQHLLGMHPKPHFF